MKKSIVACLLFILFTTIIPPAHASVTIQATIDQGIQVALDFKNIDSTVYEEVRRESLFNRSTIPQAIVNNLKQRNLTRVAYHDSELVFNDLKKSVHATFYLSGLDILNFTFAAMTRVYYVRTEWRKFHLNLTDLFSLNFTEYFGTPIAQWQRINYTDPENKVHPAYFYNYTGPSPFDPLCYFILPTTATNVRAIEDTIIFEAPAPLEDTLLNSPFLILGALIVVNIAALVYRRLRK
jgi:hypothetical protein